MELLGRLDHPYVVLGNHDFAESRDPFSKEAGISEVPGGTLLLDRSIERKYGGDASSSPASTRAPGWPASCASSASPTPTCGSCSATSLVFSTGCLWDGSSSCSRATSMQARSFIPYGFGKLNLAHPRARFSSGLYRRQGTVMHVSPGLGTTFVPFRFFARPEATELTLRSR